MLSKDERDILRGIFDWFFDHADPHVTDEEREVIKKVLEAYGKERD